MSNANRRRVVCYVCGHPTDSPERIAPGAPAMLGICPECERVTNGMKEARSRQAVKLEGIQRTTASAAQLLGRQSPDRALADHCEGVAS